MVVLNKIYTRTGDDGTTALGTGERRKKYDLRVAAYGTLDETNAAVGIARLHTKDDAALDAALSRIQNDLFDVGADLTTPRKGKPGESVGDEVLQYVNRLSDYLFVASRYTNGKGARDVLWQPGQNR